jgi:hypothetical protein
VALATNRQPAPIVDAPSSKVIRRPIFGQLKIVEQIAENHIKLIPDVLISGGQQGGSSNIENLLGLALIEKLSGKEMKDFRPT